MLLLTSAADRRVRRTMDIESIKTLVHAFVTSRVDYCTPVFRLAPKVMDKLQHFRNAAARLVTGTRKYERGLSTLMHDDLHWLVILQ